MIYCMGDVHGNYEGYCQLLQDIRFNDSDTLYTIGDIVDRGSGSMKVLLDMMVRPNVFPILGNHDYMAYRCLRWLSENITEESIKNMSADKLEKISEWLYNGGETTLTEFKKLDKEQQEAVIEYLGEFTLYEEVTTKQGDFILLHGGLPDFSPEKSLDDYDVEDIVWSRCNYEEVYFPDKYLVTGHTPTRNIRSDLGEKMNDRIFRKNNHIAIDCGSGHGGVLAVICLDNMKEYYA